MWVRGEGGRQGAQQQRGRTQGGGWESHPGGAQSGMKGGEVEERETKILAWTTSPAAPVLTATENCGTEAGLPKGHDFGLDLRAWGARACRRPWPFAVDGINAPLRGPKTSDV